MRNSPWTQTAAPSWTQHKEYTTCTHLTHLWDASAHHVYEPHLSTSGVRTVRIFHLTAENFLLLFHRNSWAATLSMCTSTSKLQVFFKVRCHIYYTSHAFLNHLASVSYHFYQIANFLMSVMTCLSAVLNSSFLISLWILLCYFAQHSDF